MPIKYTRVGWQDAPSTETPIDAANLNHMDNGILALSEEMDTELPLLREQINDVSADIESQIDEKIPPEVSSWLTEHVTPAGSAVVVDDTLTIQGAAADAKKTGDEISSLREDISEFSLLSNYGKLIIEQGYFAIADGTTVNSNTWCRTGKLDRTVILNTSTVKMFLLAYDITGNYVGTWDGTGFSTTYHPDSYMRTIEMYRWVETYPQYTFKIDYTSSGTLAPSSVWSDLTVLNSVMEDISNLKSALNKNKEPLNAVWEIGNITTVDGSEVSRNDCVRTPAYPINASKDLIGIFRTDVSVIGTIFINAYFYDGRMNYLGSYKPGDSQIQGSCYIDPVKYGEVAFIRFTKMFTNSSDVSTTSDTHDIYITDAASTDSDLYAAQCKEGYEVVSFHVVKGGITGTGIVYDNDYVARSETGVYFPSGSKIVFLKDYRRYRPRIHFYYPNGRKYEGNYNDTGFITDPDEFDYSVCPDGLYAGVSFNDAHGLTLSDKNYREIENICKIIRPVKKINDSYEERIGGSVVGNQNLLQNGMPFAYEAAYWLNDGIYYKEVTEDNRIWGKDNAMISVHLKPGEYGFICSFVANEGTGNDGVGYGIWGEDGTEIILYGARYKDNYETERSFTISEEQNIYLQFKTYPGESFKVYLYSKPLYLTLKSASGLIESLNIAEDTQYHNIYDQLVEQTILKYDSVTNAGDIGYIWISDLHTNSLYPNRNKALKRQLRACAEIASRTNIKFICIGGDILDRETSRSTIFSLINNLFSGISASRKPIVVLAGNHDDNPYTNPVHLTKSQVKSLFIDMTDVKMIGDVDKCYYYFDEGNYRIICLDMIDYPQDGTYDGMSWWGFSQAQVEWLGDVLKETDKNVILLCHQTLDESHNVWNLGNNGGYTADIRNLISAYNAKTTITLYNRTYDFTAITGKVLFSHAGHAHFDEQYYLESLRAPILVTSCAKETEVQQYDGTELVEGNTYRVVTNETGGHWNSFGWTFQFYPNREIGTQSEATFDVVSVGANTVNVFRVGAGVDRSFNLT